MDTFIAVAIGVAFVLGLVGTVVYLWRNRAFKGGGDPEVADEMFFEASKNPNRILP